MNFKAYFLYFKIDLKLFKLNQIYRVYNMLIYHVTVSHEIAVVLKNGLFE